MKKHIFLLISIILFIAIILSFPQKTQAETLRLEVTKDVFINEFYTETSFCNVTSLTISTAPIKRYAFMQFEELNLSEGAVFENATVHFYVYDHGYNDTAFIRIGPNVSVGGWDECTPKWSGPYPGMYMSGDSFVDVNLDLSTGWKSVSISNVVKMWLDGVLEDAGIYFYTEDPDDFLVSLRTKENGTDSPYLEIEYSVEETETDVEDEVVPPEEETTDTETDSGTEESTEDGSKTSNEEEQEEEETSQEETSESSQKQENIRKWMIIGLSAFVFFIFVCLLVVIYFYKKEKKSQQKPKKNQLKKQNEPK
jgi:hypothetical protein